MGNELIANCFGRIQLNIVVSRFFQNDSSTADVIRVRMGVNNCAERLIRYRFDRLKNLLPLAIGASMSKTLSPPTSTVTL